MVSKIGTTPAAVILDEEKAKRKKVVEIRGKAKFRKITKKQKRPTIVLDFQKEVDKERRRFFKF